MNKIIGILKIDTWVYCIRINHICLHEWLTFTIWKRSVNKTFNLNMKSEPFRCLTVGKNRSYCTRKCKPEIWENISALYFPQNKRFSTFIKRKEKKKKAVVIIFLLILSVQCIKTINNDSATARSKAHLCLSGFSVAQIAVRCCLKLFQLQSIFSTVSNEAGSLIASNLAPRPYLFLSCIFVAAF